MKTKSIKWFGQLILVLGLLTNATSASAQYFGEQVLEKTFEQETFFFNPSFFNPYGIGGFGPAAVGLLNDPLLNLQINPAFLAADSVGRHVLKLNFRNVKDIEDQSNMWRYHYLDYASLGYPYFYTRSRKALEPVLSVAYLARPLGDRLGGLTLGLTYQAILQDEPFYTIPMDIYNSRPEADFAGNRVTENMHLPIIDRYSGSDEMHHEGHFLSVLSAASLSSRIHLGLRLSRVTFNRDGTYGSQNMWIGNIYSRGNSSDWRHGNTRSQNYGHWDISGGLNLQISQNLMAGLMAGRLEGDVSQNVDRDNASLYTNGTIGQGDNWSYYFRNGDETQRWNHSGRATYAGINIAANVSPTQRLILFYRVRKNDVNISLSSGISDTSNSDSYYKGDTWTSRYRSVSALHDARTGSGTDDTWTHHGAAALQWRMHPKTWLNLGLHVQYSTRDLSTVEHVNADRFSDSYWKHNDNEETYDFAVDEIKTLRWDFASSQTTLRIPLILRYAPSRAIDLMFGINRTLRWWRTSDVTLAIFDLRRETRNGQTETQTNFGERYTQPDVKESDVTTTLLAGLTIKPSRHFHVRLLMVPNFTKTYDRTELDEFHWWIDLDIFP